MLLLLESVVELELRRRHVDNSNLWEGSCCLFWKTSMEKPEQEIRDPEVDKNHKMMRERQKRRATEVKAVFRTSSGNRDHFIVPVLFLETTQTGKNPIENGGHG